MQIVYEALLSWYLILFFPLLYERKYRDQP